MAERIDDRLVADTARELRGEAGLAFTERQLWYAVCARLEPAELTGGTAQVAVGVLLVIVGVVFGVWGSLIVAGLAPVGMVVVGLGLQRRRAERARPTTRPLAVSYDAFARETVAPLRQRRPEALAGMLPARGAAPGAGDGGPPAPGAAPGTEGGDAIPAPPSGSADLVVCDRGETAELLEALASAAGMRLAVADESSLPARVSAGRVIAVHDADPRGCALPLRLAATGAAPVVDAGLRPGQLRGRHLQVLEGAPAVVPSELSALLTPDEVVWLADGHRVELATLGPAELVAGLRAVLGAAAAAPPGDAPAGVALAGASLLAAPPASGASPATADRSGTAGPAPDPA